MPGCATAGASSGRPVRLSSVADLGELWRPDRESRRLWWATQCAVLVGVLLAGPGAWAQTAAATPVTVSGRVVDGLHGTPLARALVRMSSRTVLTDALGRFSFPGVTDARVTLSATKPGFASENQAAEGTASVVLSDPAQAAELLLVPDGVIAGVVSGPDGQPVAGANVRIARANYDANGLTAAQTGYAQTNSEGEYRFREPAGAYRVMLSFVPSAAETGLAILPVESPNASASSAAGYWPVTPGQERRVDLRAGGGMPVPVTLHVSGTRASADDRGDRRGGVRVVVHLASGASFAAEAVGAGDDGRYVLQLPPGTFRLQVLAGGRDEVLEGSGRVTVGRKEAAGAEIQLAPFTSLPVEVVATVSAQSTSSSSSSAALKVAPNAGQLGLTLHPVDAASGSGDFGGGDIRVQERAGGGGVYEFRVPAGRYRLSGPDTSAGWTVTGAAYGAANLLGEELVVAEGSGGVPVRVSVSNAVGQIAATVNLGEAAGAWVYVIPDAPRLAPERVGRVGLTGAYNARVSPGSYTLVAVAHRLQIDFHDAKTMARLKSAGSRVEVADGGKATAQLDLHKAAEVTR